MKWTGPKRPRKYPSGLVEGEERAGVLRDGRDLLVVVGPSPLGYRASVSVNGELRHGLYADTEMVAWRLARRTARALEHAAADDLARRFCAEIRDWIDPAEMKEVVRLNAAPDADPATCATHDYCDANMAMDAAFRDVFEREPDTGSDADTRLWNEAWSRAKGWGFEPPRRGASS